MDLLSNVLATVRLKAGGWHVCDFTAPWSLVTRADFEEPFFFSIAGSGCWLRGEATDPIYMQEGDLLLVVHGGAYTLASDLSVPAVNWDDAFSRLPWSNTIKLTAPRRLSYGGGGPLTRAISTVFGFGDSRRNPLLAALPPYIYLPHRNGDLSPTLQHAREFLLSEAAPSPGYVAVAERMAELVFINIIRAHLRLHPEKTTGWLRGLSDPRISRALAAIHEQPQNNWTVAALADVATMSRAAFAERFRTLIGKSPGDYVVEWALYLAADQLASTSKSVATVAADIGYRSVNAFTHAFKRCYGVTPGEYRRSRSIFRA